jgi:rhodanese-related sulfurtransferase
MINTIKKILGLGPSVDYQEIIRRGAIIVDVRTPGEFSSGHIKGSINLPLQSLQSNLSKIKKDKPVITCCASGMRSASAKSILSSNGFAEVYNGGGWYSLNRKINL